MGVRRHISRHIVFFLLILGLVSGPGLVSPTVAMGAPAGSGTWQAVPTSGAGPTERSVPAVGSIGPLLYVFGGVKDDFSTGQNTFLKDLYRLDTRTNTWAQVGSVGSAWPPARAFAASASQDSSARMYVFGGSVYSADGSEFTVFDDFWALSTNNVWTKLPSGPSARSGATLWTAGNKLYLFGGIDQTFTTLNDLWSYDIASNKWDNVLANGAAGNPPPRHVAQSGHVASNNRLLLYGGEGDPSQGFPVLADTWEYDLVQKHWTDVTPAAGNLTPERNYAAAGLLAGGLYLQGGDIPGGSAGCGAPFPQNPTDELWRFDLTSKTWQQLKPAGAQPPRLKRQAAATVGGKLYVVSGWDFQCPGQGQVWNTTTYSYTP